MSDFRLPNKQYGLIVKNKKDKPKSVQQISSVFNQDSDEEHESFKNMEIDSNKETMIAVMKRNTKINFDKALMEDPSVFEYDEVYEQISSEQQKIKQNAIEKKNLKPKYIDNLIKQSAVRKLERDLLEERKAHRELEEEKDKFRDKEAFVTSAYKAKMKEIEELVQKRKEEEANEEIMDITKQDGLGGFYRYMYNKDIGSRHNLEAPNKLKEEEKKSRVTSSFNSQDSNPKQKNSDDLISLKSKKTDHEDRSSSLSRGHDRKSKNSHSRSPRRSHRHEERINRTRSPKRQIKTDARDKKEPKNKVPKGYVRTRPRATSSEEIKEMLKRYFERLEKGINKPDICDSEGE